MDSTMNCEMFSTSSSHSGFISRGHSTIEVGHQVRGVQRAIISMMDRSNIVMDNIMMDNIMVDNIVVANIMMDSFMVSNILLNNSMVDRMGIMANMISMAVLVGQVFCLHGSHTGLIKRGDGTIRVRL